MVDLTAVTRGTPNWKRVGLDSLPAGLLKVDHPESIRYNHNLLVNIGRRSPAIEMCDHQGLLKKRIALIATSTEGFRLLLIQAKYW